MEKRIMPVEFMKLDSSAVIPSFGRSELDAGLDFVANEWVLIPSGESRSIATGVAWNGMALVTSYEKPVLIIKSRSGLAFKNNVEASNAGVVDAEYTGEIKVKLYNHGGCAFLVNKGDRIAQGIVYMIPHVRPVEVFSLPTTVRGTDGFGSTEAVMEKEPCPI